MLLILGLDLSNKYDQSFVTYVDRNKWLFFHYHILTQRNTSYENTGRRILNTNYHGGPDQLALHLINYQVPIYIFHAK